MVLGTVAVIERKLISAAPLQDVGPPVCECERLFARVSGVVVGANISSSACVFAVDPCFWDVLAWYQERNLNECLLVWTTPAADCTPMLIVARLSAAAKPRRMRVVLPRRMMIVRMAIDDG